MATWLIVALCIYVVIAILCMFGKTANDWHSDFGYVAAYAVMWPLVLIINVCRGAILVFKEAFE